MKIPNSPFCTRLSGSAKETELRIRSIFQWKKKRPPMVLLILAAVLLLGVCSGLVGFSDQQTDKRYLASLEVSEGMIYVERHGLRSFDVYWQPGGKEPVQFATVTRAKVFTVELTEYNGKLAVRYTDSYNDLSCIYVYVLSDDQAPEYLVAGASKPGTDPSNEVPEIKELLGLADAHTEESDAPARPTPPDSDVKEPQPTPKAETEVDVYTLKNLNLDGSGANDDALTVTTVRPHDGIEGHVAMTVRLGTGQELEYEVANVRYICNGIFTPYLTSTERQTIVLELAYWGANWAGCDDILLEVKDGAVTEVCVLSGEDTENALNTQSTLYGLEVVDREDSPLQAMRVPTYVGKWHGPDIGTLTWEDGQWKFVLDGYYTDDWYTAVVDSGMELTISLRGRINRESLIWYYDQIQILHGDTVIQTITEDSFTPDDHCRFDFFNADVPNKSVHVKDINFDGNDDFAVSCNRYHNDGYCWFLYDPQLRQFRYAFSLSGQPTLDLGQKQIVETWQDDYGENITYNTYEYDNRGKLVLVESRKEAEAVAGLDARNAYADALETLVNNHVLPDGNRAGLSGDMAENRFAVLDVDGDGREELILLYTTTYTAGHVGFVFDFDEATQTMRTQFLEYPMLTFYENGAVKAELSHNQGWAGRFWPYFLYQYRPDTDSYQLVGQVDAWDKEFVDANFPNEIDTSGTGFVYYIMEDGEYDNSDPVDASVYHAWLESHIGGVSEIDIPYLALTAENIQMLRSQQ